MKASKLIEFSARHPACTLGPELLMVMIGFLSLGVMLGAVSATAGVAVLAGATGAVLFTTLADRSIDGTETSLG